MYVSTYGSDRQYPPAEGEGFWNTLRNAPTPGQAIARGNDGLFVCKVLRTKPSPTALDYQEPIRPVVDGLTQPQWPIACDRPTNHDPSGMDDVNIMFFSGSVTTAGYGSPEWNIAINYTK